MRQEKKEREVYLIRNNNLFLVEIVKFKKVPEGSAPNTWYGQVGKFEWLVMQERFMNKVVTEEVLAGVKAILVLDLDPEDSETKQRLISELKMVGVREMLKHSFVRMRIALDGTGDSINRQSLDEYIAKALEESDRIVKDGLHKDDNYNQEIT